jgi:hypothetical protein
MNTAITRVSAFMFFSAAFAAANAEYRCSPPQTVNDRLACEAAKQGPEALRRYINSWPSQMANLQFYDYADDQTLKNWETKRMAAQKTKDENAPQVASNERR